MSITTVYLDTTKNTCQISDIFRLKQTRTPIENPDPVF